MPTEHVLTGGSLAMILGTDVRLESPNPTPFIYQAKWKTWPIHILPISKIDPIHILFLKIDPIHILFFKFYPFIYFLGEKDTPLIYFWCKNDTHSYTGRPEKYTPFQPHICIYLYNGSYPPVHVLLSGTSGEQVRCFGRPTTGSAPWLRLKIRLLFAIIGFCQIYICVIYRIPIFLKYFKSK